MKKSQIKTIKEILAEIEKLEKENEKNRIGFIRSSFEVIVKSLVVFMGAKTLNSILGNPTSIFNEYDKAVDKVLRFFSLDPKIKEPLEKAIILGLELTAFMDQDLLKELSSEEKELFEGFLELLDYDPIKADDPIDFLTAIFNNEYETIQTEILEITLTRSFNLIKDIFNDGKKEINLIISSELLNSEVLDHTDKENNLVKKITDTLVLGENEKAYKVPEWRAKLQARNEVMASLRNASYAADIKKLKLLGIKPHDGFWEHFVIRDNRLSKICKRLNKTPIRTAREWTSVSPYWNTYGNHVNCRCTWALTFRNFKPHNKAKA